MTERAAPPASRLFTPGRVLLLAVMAGYCLLVLFPVVKRRFGIFDNGMWFLDSYAVLASSDAVRAGLDPSQPNPLDVLQRQHSYSNWWFLLGRAGLTREQNFLVGGSWVLAFFAAALAVLRPGTYREATLGAALLLSPPVVLAVNRANNDLVVFAVLAVGLLALRKAEAWRLGCFAVSLVLATGLKFYPLVAGVALVCVRPPKRGAAATALTLGAALLTLASVWTDLGKAVFPAPTEAFTFGAPILFRDLGWTGTGPLLAGAALLTLVATVCFRQGWLVRLDGSPEDLRERLMFAAGAALVVGCFLAGISHAYRLIYMVFLMPLLWRRAADPVARRLGVLLLALLWLDGFYCLGANVLVGAMPLAELVHRQLIWRAVTQPVVWVAMALLAGSLVEMALLAWRDWRNPQPGT